MVLGVMFLDEVEDEDEEEVESSWKFCGMGCSSLFFLDLRYCALRLSSRTMRLEKIVPAGVRLGTLTLSSSARRRSYVSGEHPHLRAIISEGSGEPFG